MIIDITLWIFLVLMALLAVSLKDLYSSSFVLGAYSFVICLLWTRLNAVDVAFTEAAVGAGVSTVILIGAILRTSRHTKCSAMTLKSIVPSFIICVLLIYGTKGLPDYADPKAPIQTHVAPRYIKKSFKETGVPNMVTGVLAYYRGYDTLGETTVVFTAAAAVSILLRNLRKPT